jgi:signal transduction histidine kinase
MAEGGGELRIATAVENDSIRMEFEDTGCGIPGEQMKKIFEPFFTTKPIGKGTGLGLFITHQILTDLGGTVHVRSQCGAGTTFTVRIPRSGGGDPA